MISMDFLGPLPMTVNGNRYLLVINDYATRYCLAFPVARDNAATVAKILVERVFLEYGAPHTILSDRGPHFFNELLESITQLFEVHQVFSSGYRPQTAGLTERFNQTLIDLLAVYVNKHCDDWDEYVPYVLFAYRTLYNQTVKDIPFYLLYGYEPPLPHEMYILPTHVNQSTADQTRNLIAQRLKEARNLARTSIAAVQKAIKANRDANRKASPFKPGDLVMSIKPRTNTFGKLSRIYDGPYRVNRILPGGRTLHLTHINTGEIRVSHVDNVKSHSFGEDLRPTRDMVDNPIPKPSPQQERRAIEMLERAAAQAKHVVGAARSRAVIADILGYLQVPPNPTTSSPIHTPQPTPQPPNVEAPTPREQALPDPIPSNPEAPQELQEEIPWKSDKPWFYDKPRQDLIITGTTRSGRHTRKPKDLVVNSIWIDFNTDNSFPCQA